MVESVRDLARRAARSSYSFTRWRLLRRWDRAEGTPIVVLSMGKTGSSAIYHAVRDQELGPTYKVHMLAPTSITDAERHYRETDPDARPQHVFQAAHLARHLPTPDAPWRVITIVREPLAQAVSEFFQAPERTGRLRSEPHVATALQAFVRRHLPRTLSWFERELEPYTGIDVYGHAFDPSAGAAIVESPQADLLVLRTEDLDRAGDALGRFLALPGPLPLAVENAGADKQHGDLYRSAVRSVTLDPDLVDLACSSRLSRHFYAPAELDRARAQWLSPADGTDP